MLACVDWRSCHRVGHRRRAAFGSGGPGRIHRRRGHATRPRVRRAPGRVPRCTGYFDLAGRAATVPTDWPSGATPWLALDRNGNGASGAAFDRLVVWGDRNGDRRSDGELVEAATFGLVALRVEWQVQRRCDGRGNCEVERAEVLLHDRPGHRRSATVVDVHLAAR